MYRLDSDLVKELYMSGFWLKSIGKLLGVHKAVVRKVFKDLPEVKRDKNTVDGFWDKINKSDRSCWIWQGGVNNKGYGQFRLNGKLWFVHRLSYTLIKGEIPKRLFVCHKCDNPRCCNPNHLFLGNQSDNMVDMVLKRRHHNVIATPDQIRDIRKHKQTYTPTEISKIMSISIHIVKSVLYEDAWNHVK